MSCGNCIFVLVFHQRVDQHLRDRPLAYSLVHLHEVENALGIFEFLHRKIVFHMADLFLQRDRVQPGSKRCV